MHQYHTLLRHILNHGQDRGDRTGTGTRSVFGYQMRFDLAEGFPLVTSKRTHFPAVVAELLWFLRGSTNARELNALGATIWDEWADEDGDLGPIYGAQWVKWGAKPTAMKQRPPTLPSGVPPTYLGVASGSGKEGHPLKKVWEGMIARCYDPNSISYPHYGARGVSVCDRWLQFSNFAGDAVKLPGYERRLSGERMELDKDHRGSGFLYSLETCKWVTPRENQQLSARRITVEGPDGVLHTFANPSTFCREQGIPDGNFSDLWTGRKNAKVRHGYRLVSVEDDSNGVNQIQGVIDSLRDRPHSRRHIVSAWNPQYLPDETLSPQDNATGGLMALPPCHCLFQFYVDRAEDGRQQLSCQLYQRSGDSFLGVPFNIASYALLVHLIAHHVGMAPGEFVWTGGDVHLYHNHFDQARELLERRPGPLPYIHLLHRQDLPLHEVEYGHLALDGYNPHPAIKAPVAV